VIQEPQSAFGTIYPNNHVLKTPGGHIKEYDDTPGSKRNHEWHPSGSYRETRNAGSVVDKTVGDRAVHTLGNHQEHRVADTIEVFDGKVIRTIRKDVDEEHQRDSIRGVRGNAVETVDGAVTRTIGGLVEDNKGSEVKLIAGPKTESVAESVNLSSKGPNAETVARTKSETHQDRTVTHARRFARQVRAPLRDRRSLAEASLNVLATGTNQVDDDLLGAVYDEHKA